MADAHVLPASVSHVSNESTLSSACSNASLLFEAAVLSQLAIILKNQEEVKSRISKMERNLAQVAAARSKTTPTPSRNVKLQKDQQCLPKNNFSILGKNDQLHLQIPHRKPVVSQMMNNCFPQPLKCSVTRDTVPAQAIKNPADHEVVLHDPPIIPKEKDVYHEPVVAHTALMSHTESAPQICDMQDDTIPQASVEQRCDGNATTTLPHTAMNAIHPASMVTQVSASSFQQPLTMHPSARLNMNSSQQQTAVETLTLFSQDPSQEQIAKDTSATPHQIDEGSLQENNGVEGTPMSTEDLIQQTLNIQQAFTLPEGIKNSFESDGKIYSTPQPIIKKQFNDQDSRYTITSTGQYIVKEEPKNFNFSPRDLLYLRSNSISIKNFAKKLSEEVYTIQEMKTSNCSGTKGKRKLDPDRLKEIKKAVFEVYEIGVDEQKATWQQCKDAINEFCRRKPNKYSSY